MQIKSSLLHEPVPGTAAAMEPSQTSVTFGAVTVKVTRPSESMVLRNIEAGQAALRQAKTALVKSGVKISRPKGQPLYFGSSERPDLIIREVNGVRTFGKFSSGKFRIAKGTCLPGAGIASKAAKKA